MDGGHGDAENGNVFVEHSLQASSCRGLRAQYLIVGQKDQDQLDQEHVEDLKTELCLDES